MANKEQGGLGSKSVHMGPATAFAFAAFACIGVWAYWATLTRVARTWSADPDYSHGYLVIPLAVFFLWLRRAERPAVQLGFHPLGLIPLVVAGMLRYLAGRLYLPELDAWSIPIWIGGACWTLLGWPFVKWSLPSLAFLWFATPLPGRIALALSTPLQLIAAQLSGVALQLFGQPAIVEGTTILLGEQTLEVERACSGLRMFYGVTALAFATILITRPGIRKTIGILLAIAPVAIFVNVLRITSNGLMTSYSLSETTRRLSHDLAGLIVIPLALFLFMGLLWLFDRISLEWQASRQRTARWLTAIFVLGMVIAGIGGWWYSFQKGRALATLLATADRFEQDGDLPMAIQYLDRYTRARPSDSIQQIHLAEVFSKAASSQGEKLRAAELLRNAFHAQPKRRDLAIKSIDLAAQTESFPFALDLLAKLESSTADKNDKELTEKRADVLLSYLNSSSGTRQNDFTWDDVAAALERSVKQEAYAPRHLAALAVITRQHLNKPSVDERAARADALMDKLVTDRNDDPEAWLTRYRYRTVFGKGDDAHDVDKDLDRALELRRSASPGQQVEILLVAAERSLRQDRTGAAARLFLQEAIAASPTATQPYLALADIFQRNGDAANRQEAIRVLQDGVKATGDQSTELVIALAQALATNGDDAEVRRQLAPIQNALPRISDGQTRGLLALGIAMTESIQLRRQGQIAKAADCLNSALDSADVKLAANGRHAKEVERSWLVLAELYQSLHRREAALSAIQQAARLNPDSTSARAAVIGAALASGEFEMAVVESRRRTQQDPTSGEAWTTLAIAELQQQLQLAPERRNFSGVERSLAQAKKLAAPQAPFLAASAELLRAQNRRPQATQLLERSLQQDPEQPQLWQLLAITKIEVADFEAANAAIDKFANHGGTPSAVAALRANVLVASGNGEEAVALLDQANKALDGNNRLEVMMVAAEIQRQLGKAAEANSLLEQAHQEFPTEIGPLEKLTRSAADDGDWDRVDQYVNELRQLEGADGTLWKSYHLMRLLAKGSQLDQQQRVEVETLSRDIADARPKWSMGQFFLAQAAMLQNDNEDAIERLQAAWELGLRDVMVAEPLLELLAATGRQTDIELYANEMGDLAFVSPKVYDRLMTVLLRSDRGESALAQARTWAEGNPSTSRAQMRLGRASWIYSAMSRNGADEKAKYQAEAEKSFLEAVRLAPNEASTWSALLAYYVQTQQVSRADKLLNRFKNEANLDPIAKQLALAQFYDMLPRTASAIKEWRTAVKLALEQKNIDTQVDTLSQAAAYFSASAPRTAERYCRLALEADAKAVVPRLILVRLLGGQNEPTATNEAIGLADGLPDEPPRLADEKRRLLARLLSNRSGDGDTEKAIQLLEQIESQTTSDKLLLAQLYGDVGRTATAYEILDEIVSTPSAQAEELIAFLTFWQKYFQAGEQFGNRANEVLARLGQLPNGLPEQLRWEIRLAKSSGQSDSVQAKKIVESLCDSPLAKQAWKNEQVAQTLLYGILQVLLDENCVDEAEAICRRPPGTLTPQIAARLLANAILMGHTDEAAHVAACEKLLDEVLTQNPTDLSLLQDAGDLASVTAHAERAAALYNRILAIDPKHQGAQNNLATLLSVDPNQRLAALQRVQRALSEYPQAPSLLNTKGEILIGLDRVPEALKVLTLATEIEATDPCVYLHIAMAQNKMGQENAAAESFVIAAALGVERRPLSPADREAVSVLKSKFEL